MKLLLTFTYLSLLTFSLNAQQKITFSAPDSVTITADLYLTNPENSPMIVLFHQAGWSRGEYLEIAPKLNKLGYNCIAIDQRSGEKINEISNITYLDAKVKSKPTTFIDAEIDMNAAIDYVKKTYAKASKLIIWGSSYSAALALKIAGERKDVDAVLAFAPGEYFKRFGKPQDYIAEQAQHIKIPVFITSAKKEKESWWSIFEIIPSKNKQYFLPETEGQHGSRALWEKFPEHKAYWKAVTSFLKSI